MFPFPFRPVNLAPLMGKVEARDVLQNQEGSYVATCTNIGRMVLFSSTQLAHRTMPAFAPRMVLSLWFKSSKAQRLPLPCTMPPAGVEVKKTTVVFCDAIPELN